VRSEGQKQKKNDFEAESPKPQFLTAKEAESNDSFRFLRPQVQVMS
jgi:hypothetical protein